MERAVFVAALDRLPPPAETCDRLYLGSEFCDRRLPGGRGLHEAADAAARRGMAFTLVTPFLDEPGLQRVLALVRALPADGSTEVVANDLGLIEALRGSGWEGTIVAGRLLARQRRGAGLPAAAAVPPEAAAALRGSALDSRAFVDLLVSRYAVRRFELDDLVQGTAVSALPGGVGLSLYRPWLLVTATRNCPWVFDGHAWDRASCDRPCRGRLLRLTPVDGEPSTTPAFPGKDPETAVRSGQAEGWRGGEVSGARFERDGGPQRQDPAACTGTARGRGPALVLGGCAQFLEHRSTAPPPPGVDRIVWQPEVPA